MADFCRDPPGRQSNLSASRAGRAGGEGMTEIKKRGPKPAPWNYSQSTALGRDAATVYTE
jgi:hypothetical protein